MGHAPRNILHLSSLGRVIYVFPKTKLDLCIWKLLGVGQASDGPD